MNSSSFTKRGGKVIWAEDAAQAIEEILKICREKEVGEIWVEGKSAMWRYPSEVPELKDYSEAEEEQPYDRFYKKQNIVTDSVQNQKSTAQKQVYVSMPDKQVKEVKTNSSLLKKTENHLHLHQFDDQN